jgi:hypothetical protein
MAPSDLAGLWFEFEVKRPAPNGETVTESQRSIIFDRLTPESRIGRGQAQLADKPFRTGDLIISGGIALAGFVRSPIALVDAEAEGLLASRKTLSDRLSGSTARFSSVADEGAAIARVWHQLSESLASANCPPSDHVRIYYDRPRYVVYTSQVEFAPDAAPRLVRTLDILEHRLAVWVDGDDRGLAEEFVFQQGIADTLAETWLIGTSRRTISAQTVLAEAFAGGIELLVLTPGDVARVDPLPLSDAAKTYLRRDLNGGNIVIVPSRSPEPDDRRIAWWRYDPKDGSILGIGELGKGSAFMEYVEPLTLTGALLGLPAALVITAGICGGFTVYHGQGADYFANCMNVAIMTEILSIMTIALTAAMGGGILATVGLMFYAGLGLATYGLLTENTLVRDVGIGLALTPVLTPIGVAFGRHVLTPVARELVEQVRTIRMALGRAPLEAAVPAVAVAGRGFVNGVEPAGETVFMNAGGRSFHSRRPPINFRGQGQPSVPLDEALTRSLGREQAQQVEEIADELLYRWSRLPKQRKEIQALEYELDKVLRDLPRSLQKRVNQKIYLAMNNKQTYRGLDLESLVPIRRPNQTIEEWIGVGRLSDEARQTARQGAYRDPTSWRTNQATPDVPPLPPTRSSSERVFGD